MDLEEFYQYLSDEEKNIFSEIAGYAIKLGYKPKKAKTQAINYVFNSNKTKKHIMKFSIEQGRPILKMKFYASTDYSHIFHESVRAVMEEYNYKYTGCYNCGKCKDQLEGYEYKYSDGREYFRCGGELISIQPITNKEIPEIMKLLHTQHQYYLSKRKV
ncbi:translation initiation factor 2 beta subunit (eIF-2beta)/eIF-5 [Paenibacillus forsythiae]|uniref:Translation initiation factor 2 beta subunit (eIF-2beta)/eIF-5 n=1 Tax=Paenibacillus forsythiae TaxID=365616 RepID=A0ABU3HGK6_9BACL|nr:hypothetical protein [Paenibacillus forsythiae]MDT3429152.1 translation initiation factor 2 beta subunit (eIF-2beta)/eIF-5 [Paenibacillus forsythiae]